MYNLLEKCFPYCQEAASIDEVDSNQFIFRAAFNDSIECQRALGGCGRIQEQHHILKLGVEGNAARHPVQNLLTNSNSHRIMPKDKCDLGSNGCKTVSVI